MRVTLEQLEALLEALKVLQEISPEYLRDKGREPGAADEIEALLKLAKALLDKELAAARPVSPSMAVRAFLYPASMTAEVDRPEEPRAASMEEARKRLAEAVRQLEAYQALRKDILVKLLRRGRAFPLELAAACLTFVENIRPVLEDLEREGLIRIRQVAGSGMEVIELTPKGRDAARRAGGP